MSLEKALDDERKDVLDILEGRPRRSLELAGPPTGTSPPVRSMLDIGGPSASHISPFTVQGADQGSGLASGPNTPMMTKKLEKSSLAVDQPARKQTTSKTFHMPGFGAPSRARHDRDKESVDLIKDYDFGTEPHVQGTASPGRASQEGKKPLGMRSMAAVMQGQQFSPLPGTSFRGRHNSTDGVLGGKSKTPFSQPEDGPKSSPKTFTTEDGKVIDMSNAHRRFSDAAVADSRKEQAQLYSGDVHLSTEESDRKKDYYPDEEAGEDAVGSSDDENYGDSSADDTLKLENARGRRRRRQKKDSVDEDSNAEGSEADKIDIKKGPLASKYKVKSLLEPTVTITGPGGERLLYRKSGVHPNTNYDQSASRNASPTTSDSDEMNDIRRAQKMQINSSPVDSSIPHRVIRTIIRGDFAKMQEEAEEGSRRLRTYLVATDLSGEAAYALEWTIGTVLRDGDTLLAVYAVDEEIGTGKTGDTDGIVIGEGAKAMQDTTALVDKMTTAALNILPSSNASPSSNPTLTPGSGKGSGAGSTDSRHMSKAEQERLHAIEGISQTCIKFLRKTKLQVRIAVEVIHCKSPKYMITEAVSALFPRFPTSEGPPQSHSFSPVITLLNLPT